MFLAQNEGVDSVISFGGCEGTDMLWYVAFGSFRAARVAEVSRKTLTADGTDRCLLLA